MSFTTLAHSLRLGAATITILPNRVVPSYADLVVPDDISVEQAFRRDALKLRRDYARGFGRLKMSMTCKKCNGTEVSIEG